MSTTTEFRSTKKRSVIAPSNVVVTKTPVSTVRMSMGGGYMPGNVIERQTRRVTYAGPPGYKPGVASQVTKDEVKNVIQTRDRDRFELEDLNKKLCDHIEGTAYLAATNEALNAELDKLRKSKGWNQDRVSDVYKTELTELRDANKTLEDSIAPLRSSIIAKEDENEKLQLLLKERDEEIERLNDKVNQLGNENGDLEGQYTQQKNELDRLTQHIKYLEDQNEFLQNDNRRMMKDCEEAVTKQIQAEDCLRALEEELDFIKQATEEEIIELQSLVKQKQNPAKMQDVWKKNFGTAVNTMKQHFRDELQRCTDEIRRQSDERVRVMQMGINRDTQDASLVKNENSTLRSQLNDRKKNMGDLEATIAGLKERLKNLQEEFDDAREECDKEKEKLRAEVIEHKDTLDDVLEQLKDLQHEKLGLDNEIATYRKLLEGEETRSVRQFVEKQQRMQSQGGADLAQIISGGGGGGGGSSMQSTMNESHGKIAMKRVSKCQCSITDPSHDGAFCTIENTSATKEADLGNWKLERHTYKGCVATHKFPPNFRLKKGQSIKIFGSDFAKHKEKKPDDIVSNMVENWQSGNGNFYLKDPEQNIKSDLDIRFT